MWNLKKATNGNKKVINNRKLCNLYKKGIDLEVKWKRKRKRKIKKNFKSII